MSFDDRYSSAIRSSNLRSEAKTNSSSVDVIGAAGLAAKQHALALALLRLFTGDNGAAEEIIRTLTDKLSDKAYAMGNPIARADAKIMAQQVLEWFRNDKCPVCHGHRYEQIPGTPTIGKNICKACRGSGIRNVDKLFPWDRVELGRWLIADMDSEVAAAGPAAMAKLAGDMDL